MRAFSTPKKFDYNLIALGAGAAGLVTSYIAAAVKAKAALIEEHRMGGDCLNTGCVPSKAIIRTAKLIKEIRRAHELGLVADKALADQFLDRFDFAKAMERVQEKIKRIEPNDSIERYEKLGVVCLKGRATMKSPYEVEVNGQILTARNFVLATGAEPFVPDLPGLAEVGYKTSDSLWDLRERPTRLVVIGGGPIGCELAQAFARLGSKVTLVEAGPRLLGREDEDVSDFVAKRFSAEGISLQLKTRVTGFKKTGSEKTVLVEQEGKPLEFSTDEILIAIGRKARTTGFGLEELGIAKRPDGTIAVDPYLRTNVRNIFAAGDVTGPYQFTHAAAHQAWFCSVNALFGQFRKFKADYRVLPWVTYVDPEIARVGLSEREARAANISYEVYRFEMHELDRAIVDSDDAGFVKVLVAAKTDRILGACIIATRAGEMLAEFTLAMKYKIGLNKILGTIHPYPTFSEASKYVAGVWKKQTAPQGVLKWIEKYHSWMRGS